MQKEIQTLEATFFDHLQKAYELHHIHDVYIIEHRDCGAYKEFLGDAGEFHDGQGCQEKACHRKYARRLKKEIEKWAAEKEIKLLVRAFLMDLRGNVKLLVPRKKSQ